MAAEVPLTPSSAILPATTFCGRTTIDGTNFPVEVLQFDAAADEEAYWSFQIQNYTSGNLTLTVLWYADNASTGDVVFGGSISAINPNVSTQDIETDALATETTATDSHIGTTAKRLHSVLVTISNLDGLNDMDWLTLRFRRLGTNGSDTMANDANVVGLNLSYS